MTKQGKDTEMAIFYNRATLTYNGQSLNSNQVTGEIREAISMTKTAISSGYSVGDSIAYAVNIINSGSTAVSGLTLTDDLGAYTVGSGTVAPLTYRSGSLLYYVGGTLQAAPTVTTGATLTISGISIPAGSNATLIYEAVANSYAPLAEGSSITNTATLSGSTITSALTDTAQVSVTEEPNLSIAKAISPDVITADGTLTYTFIIQNTGNVALEASDGVVITDTFDPILSNITVTLNGQTLTEGTDYTYDATSGVFSTVSGVVTLSAATFTQDQTTGLVTVDPGVAVLTVSGTV